MSDQTVVVIVVLFFAVAVASHVAIAFGLLRRTPRWRAPIALLAPPLAPYWAMREGMPVRALFWLAAVVGYVTMRLLFRR